VRKNAQSQAGRKKKYEKEVTSNRLGKTAFHIFNGRKQPWHTVQGKGGEVNGSKWGVAVKPDHSKDHGEMMEQETQAASKPKGTNISN